MLPVGLGVLKNLKDKGFAEIGLLDVTYQLESQKPGELSRTGSPPETRRRSPAPQRRFQAAPASVSA